MEKKVYETPEVTKVEIDFSDRIVAAGCDMVEGSIFCHKVDMVRLNS